jgi:alkylhydroperoxidase family enzyme
MGTMARVKAPEVSTGNVVRDSVMGLVPETVDDIATLNARIWDQGVRPAILEVMRLRNARTVNCVFCKSVRYDVARQDGLTEDRVAQIRDGHQDSDLPEEEKLALAFADVYLHDPKSMSAELWTALGRHFTDQQIAVMAIGLGTFNAASRCAVSLGGMPEDNLPVMEISVPQ